MLLVWVIVIDGIPKINQLPMGYNDNLIGIIYKYCLWIETLLYGNFAKIIMALDDKTINMANDQFKMIMRHKDPSTIIIKADELSLDEISFIKEMGKITGENMHCELGTNKSPPTMFADTHDDFVREIYMNDLKTQKIKDDSYIIDNNGLHEKIHGVTSSMVYAEIDLTINQMSMLIISNKDGSSNKHLTSLMAIIFAKDGVRIVQRNNRKKTCLLYTSPSPRDS